MNTSFVIPAKAGIQAVNLLLKTNLKNWIPAFAGMTFLLLSQPASAEVASYKEIPYYLRQLQETQLESKRMEFNKIIHDAIVNANLSDKKTVKNMEPIVDKVRVAMDSGFDRAYLEGTSMWLGSAVDYFDREKLRSIAVIPEKEWMSIQTKSLTGAEISIYPDKILLHNGGKTSTATESAGIHEAIISPNGRRVAFFRRTDGTSAAEIWVVNLKNLKRKKITTLPSCATLLFSLDGESLFVQETPTAADKESSVLKIPASGGKPKKIGTARTLDAIVSDGKNKGALIVYRLTKHHMGTSQQECAVAWTESGREIGRLKDVPCR